MLAKGLDVYSEKYKLKDNKLLLAATFLDPKYKKFSKFSSRLDLLDDAENFIIGLLPYLEDASRYNTDQINPNYNSCELNIDMFSDASSQMTSTFEDNSISKLNKLKAELYEYKNDPRLENFLLFWAQNKEKYFYLSQIARIVLCTPASSVPCEELFSHGGYQIWDRRNKLNHIRINKMLFLYENYSNNL